jgi:hypothetical protein
MKRVFSNRAVLVISTNSSCVQEDLLSNGNIKRDIGCDDVEGHRASMRRSVGILRGFPFQDLLRTVSIIGAV